MLVPYTPPVAPADLSDTTAAAPLPSPTTPRVSPSPSPAPPPELQLPAPAARPPTLLVASPPPLHRPAPPPPPSPSAQSVRSAFSTHSTHSTHSTYKTANVSLIEGICTHAAQAMARVVLDQENVLGGEHDPRADAGVVVERSQLLDFALTYARGEATWMRMSMDDVVKEVHDSLDVLVRSVVVPALRKNLYEAHYRRGEDGQLRLSYRRLREPKPNASVTTERVFGRLVKYLPEKGFGFVSVDRDARRSYGASFTDMADVFLHTTKVRKGEAQRLGYRHESVMLYNLSLRKAMVSMCVRTSAQSGKYEAFDMHVC